MPLRPTTLIATLAFLYFGPGLLFLYVAEGSDRSCPSAALATAKEPGESLVVTGTLYLPDGETPAAGVELYAYHTDAEGLYSETNDNTDPRLRATVVTDVHGCYELRTIKPAPYPGGGVPAHIHFRASGNGVSEQRFDLNFAGDPYLSSSAEQRSSDRGKFGFIRSLESDAEGGWRVTHDVRLR